MFPKKFTHNRFGGSRSHRFGGNRNNRRNGNGEKINAGRYVNTTPFQASPEVHPITHKFSDFPVDGRIKQNIAVRGYTIPTPIQDQAITPILEGRDVIGIANTGTGKTAAFLIPLINKIIHNMTERVLIVVPTRELAVQIDDELQIMARGIRIPSLLCIGGASINRQIASLRQNPNIVIGTPGRLKDLSQRRFLNLYHFKTIVLDEVDRMVDIGFREDIKYLISLLSQPRQSLFFSATVSSEVNSIIQTFVKNPITVSVKVQETVPQIHQDIIRVNGKEAKIEKLNSLLRQEEFKKVLIFGRTKWGVERLFKTLAQRGFNVASIHGNKSLNQRLRVLTQFKQNQLRILVATDVAARGLDIDDVSHVINYDEPSTYTDYIHRIGRTGRAQKMGKALTFVG